MIIPLVQNEWVDLYAETGVTVGSQLSVVCSGASVVRLASTQSVPSNPATTYPVIYPTDSRGAVNSTGDLGAWARSETKGALYVLEVKK